MSDSVIQVENLGKRYSPSRSARRAEGRIRRSVERQRYIACRPAVRP